ncbi:hypothetical protein GGF31_005634 [Allomyces arbusculus]|nr:hypothetical protein GGF31_005634 [Allomyces arbusculus]
MAAPIDMTRRLVPALVLLLAVIVAGATAAQFTLLVSLPLTGEMKLSATGAREVLEASVDDVNAWAGANGGHKFSLDIRDSAGGMAPAVKNVFDAGAGNSTVGVIGDFGSAQTEAMALAANSFKLWMCSGAATSPDLSDKDNYPFFYRTIPPDSYQGPFLARFIRLMDWKSVALLFASDSYGTGIMTTFTQAADEFKIQVATSQSFTPGDTRGYSVAIDAIKSSGTRIVLYIGVPDDFIAIAREARKAGIIADRDWVWVGAEGLSSLLAVVNDPSKKYTDEDRDNMNGVMYAFPQERGSQYKAFFDTYKNKFPGRQDTTPYSVFFRDCFFSMARGIVKMIGSTNVATVSGRSYASGVSIKDFLVSFEGTSGPLSYDKDGDREADYTIVNLYQGKATPVFSLPAKDKNALTSLATATYYSGRTDKPTDRPSYMIAYVTYLSAGGIVVMGLVGLVILIILATVGYLVVQRAHPAVKSMSLPFLIQIALGLVLILGDVFLWMDIPSPLTCNLQVWVFIVGFELFLTAVAAKTWRTWKIFDNKSLAKLHNLTDTRLFLATMAIVLVQAIVLVLWTLLAPMKPVLVATTSSISYKCESANKVALGTLFQTISLVYNAIILLVVSFLAYKTRKVYSTFRESKFIAYTAENIFLCGVVVTPFLYLATDNFALAAWWIRVFTVIYAVSFAYACLVGRIALVPYMASKAETSGGIKMSFEKGSSNDGTSSAEQMPGKPQTMSGKYPVKVANKLFATWHTHRLTLFALEGFLGMTRLTNNTEQGTIFKLRSIQFDPNPAQYPLCLELRMDSTAYLVQFNREEDKNTWIKALSVHCLVYSRSSGNKSTGGPGASTATPGTGGGTRQLQGGPSFAISAAHYGATSTIGLNSTIGGGGGAGPAAGGGGSKALQMMDPVQKHR